MLHRFFFVILFLFLGLAVFSQNNPLEKRATIAVQKECLENVLTSITKQTGLRFSYNSQLIDPKTKVTVNAQNKTVKEILSVILPPSVSFKKVGEYIVFFQKKVENQQVEKVEQKKNQKNTISDNGTHPDSCLNRKDSIILTNQEIDMNIKELMLVTTMTATMAATPALAQDTLSNDAQQQQFEQPKIEQMETVQFQEEIMPIKCKPAQLTFFYPLGTGLVKSAEKCYHFSLNILGGVTGQVNGVELGSLFNINRYGAKGVQFAGIFNSTSAKDAAESSRNAQFAGIFNRTQKGKSAQFAGIFNVGDTAYVQAAGIFNRTNSAYFQAAGIFNHGNNAYFQAAGIVNVAKQTKFQIAGILNITQKGRFQAGLINVRDTADGVSLGLINVVKKGGVKEFGIEAGEFIHTALTFRSGVKRLYSIISVGGNYTEKFFTIGAGLGTSVKLIGNLSMNFELTHSALYNIDDFKDWRFSGWRSLTQFSPMLNYRFAKHFKMYLGPTLNLCIQKYEGDKRFLIKVPYSLYNLTDMCYTNDIWVGVVGGIKF